MFAALFAGLSYVITAIIRAGAMRKINESNPSLYSRILGGHSRAWLERGGMYLPSDIPVVWRLHKYLFSNDGTNILSDHKHNFYQFFSIMFFVMLLVTILLFITFVLCVVSLK